MPDVAGHGAAPPAGGDLWSEAHRLGAANGRALWVGYSAGGRICLHLALNEPSLVTGLVLVSATAGIESEAERASRRTGDNELADRIEGGGDAGLDRWLDEWLAGPLFSHLDEITADRASRRLNTAAGLAGSLRRHGTGTQAPLWERLSELTMPVAVVAGGDDEKFSTLARRLAAGIGANAELEIVKEAGHAVCFEQPRVFAEIVRRVHRAIPTASSSPSTS